MKSPRKIMVFAVAAALLAVAALWAQNPAPAPAAPGPLPAQQQPANPPAKPEQKPPAITVRTTEVVVPVTVKDRKGTLVAGLNKPDFRVFEDNVEQRVLRLITEAFPISMVVLIDNDLRQKDEQQVEPSLASIVAGMSTEDEAFICRFDQFFHEGKGFTGDQERLATELRRTVLASRSSAPPSGDPFNGPTINNAPAPGVNQGADPRSMMQIQGQATKTLDDAVYSAAMLLKDRDGLKRRKIILLISDGQNGEKFNTHKYKEALAELLQQGIAVYSVATGSEYFNRKFTRLSEYSHETGGDIYYGAKEDTFSEFYSRITEEARNQYTLVYSPQGERSIDYHTIEVRVERPGLTVLTRRGYYGGTYAAPR